MEEAIKNGSAEIPSATTAPPVNLVPSDPAIRGRLRRQAETVLADVCRCRPLDRAALQSMADTMIAGLNIDPIYVKFAMVVLGTEFWRGRFAAVPYERRLLMLPHCLRKKATCGGSYSAEGLACAGCGLCHICRLRSEALELGYTVMVAEGTPAVVQKMAASGAPCEAVLGVACLESLERCFEHVARTGVPYAAVPLLRNGCLETEAETELISRFIHLRDDSAAEPRSGYAALFSDTARLFQPERLRQILAAHLTTPGPAPDAELRAVSQAEQIGFEWLSRAGKRFRPFITLAAYRAARGEADQGFTEADLPPSVQAVAVAMELFHKASLVHDDVEDDDYYRYGAPTIYARYGTAIAVNTGDFMLGLGYRLVAAQTVALGPQCTADVLTQLAEAHVKLCRGQGAELLLTGPQALRASAADVVAIYALKTAPAFHAAMYAGLRMAQPLGPELKLVSSFCRHLGVGYQIADDLDDWRPGAAEGLPGLDFAGGRPTVLQSFAAEAGAAEQLDRHFQAVVRISKSGDSGKTSKLQGALAVQAEESLRQVLAIYQDSGAIEKARRLAEKCRRKALESADAIELPALRDLLHYLLNIVLPEGKIRS